ncbi:MAG: AI-2E family transporter [Chitinophagaceae bacterium]|nr:AI-2E family transporter [Chitinophagaceae bacterium]
MTNTGNINNQIKQVMILLLLLLMVFLSVRELAVFFPGLLGALTLYIVSRSGYFQLVYHYKWHKGRTALLYLLVYSFLLVLLVWMTFVLVEKQVHPYLKDPVNTVEQIKAAVNKAQESAGMVLVSAETLVSLQEKISGLLPSLVNDTANLVTNLAILLFFLYYMLVHGKEIETYMAEVLPLKQKNVELLASETKRLVKASALGIPLISIIQGITASIGYLLFGVNNVVLWGFLTGVFAFFPIVGTMIIWVPLVLFMYAGGDTLNATGLLFYSLIITGNVDYLARITLLKKLGQVHPVITVLGVLVGLGLFGFIGLIFGPLLVNYIILLFRIYSNEFILHKEKAEG